MSYGTAFQLIWNTVPDDMEQEYILAITPREIKRLNTKPNLLIYCLFVISGSYLVMGR